MNKDKLLIVFALVAGVIALIMIVGFVGQGNVRQMQIFWPETVRQTVSFEEINGTVQLRGISGIGGEPNPILVSRTQFIYILTIINNGKENHRLYIDGLDVQTDLLKPGQKGTITIRPQKEGIYNYYDNVDDLKILGQLKIVTVVPSDDFQGIWKDLI